MDILTLLRNAWARSRRRWRIWHAKLRRDRATVALPVLLTLGLIEPLVCIIHCQFWIPIRLHAYFAAQHQHHHHTLPSGNAVAPGDTTDALLRFIPASRPDNTGCFMDSGRGSPSDIPDGHLPAPLHEIVLTAITLLTVVMLAQHYVSAPALAPSRFAHQPPVPPPISTPV